MDGIAVLVLAAGKSSRMKSIKQLAKINDKTLLEIALEKAKKLSLHNTYCILGANATLILDKVDFKDVKIIINKKYEKGLSSSITKGINFLKKTQPHLKGVFILLADQPAIQVSYLQEMVALFNMNSTKIIASKYNTIFGVPALIPSLYFDELLKIKGDKGAKTFLNTHLDVILSPKTTTNLLDIDTLEQLNQFLNS